MPWRPMTAHDLGEVQALADTIHANHPEDSAVFAERLRLYPQGCLTFEENERLTGYALSHPWHFGMPPALNTLLGGIPHHATTYYVHDMALLPEVCGQGYARQAAEWLARHARAAGLSNLSLVAINRSQGFWEQSGYRSRDLPGLEAKLLTYGPEAVLMVHELAGAPS